MTKEEYNETLSRFHKAMTWYDTNPNTAQQEKFYDNFVELLEKLTEGFNELKPMGEEVLGGFRL